MSKWLKSNGKPIMDSQGKPVNCPTCPCTTPVPIDCQTAVDTAIQTYLDMLDPDTQQHLWTLYGTYEASYQCAEWAFDDSDSDGEGTWRLVHPASGYLLVALKKGEIVTDTTGSYEKLLTYAKTIYNYAEDKYLTIGCECRVVDHECKHRKTEPLEGFFIAGQLHVWWEGEDASDSDSEAPEYLPEYSCQVNPCDLLKLKLETAQYWHGGTLMSEGYYDWLTDPETWSYDDKNHEAFKMALKWAVETSDSESESSSSETVYNLTYIDCECSSFHTVTLTKGMTCMEYAGFCDLDDPCIDLMMLHNKANYFGWIWHGEGVICKYAYCSYNETYGDWFGTEVYGRMACAETDTGYYVVGCGCVVSDLYSKTQYGWLDYDGACACVDLRELYMTYPVEFGILDVSFGNTSKYRYTTQSPHYDPETGEPDGTYVTGTGVDFCGQRTPVGPPCNNSYAANIRCIDGNFIDYRCFCYVQRAFNPDTCEEKVQVRRIDPEGCHAYAWNGSSYYDTAEFIGHLVPFQPDEDTGFQFGGQYYHWNAEVHWNADYGFSSLGEAQRACASEVPTEDIPPNVSETVNWAPEYAPHISPPNLTSTLKPCKYTERQEYGEPVWDVRYSYYGYGVEISEDSWCCYRVQFMETNKGWLIYGLDGFHATFLRYGTDGERPEHYDPWENKCYNELKVARVDEDMHGCHSDFDWGFDDSDSDVSDSTSDDSTSDSEG